MGDANLANSIKLPKNIDLEKHSLKYFQTKSQVLRTDPIIIDDTFRNHVAKLLMIWLTDLKLPQQVWYNILYKLSIDLLENSLRLNSSNLEENSIHFETSPSNNPSDSKFLVNVYKGTPINKDEYSIYLPMGGTISLYGSSDEAITKNLFKLMKSLIYLVNCLYLETYVMRESHVRLTTTLKTKYLRTQIDSDKPSNNQPKERESTFDWIKRITRLSPSKNLKTYPENQSFHPGLSVGNMSRKPSLSSIKMNFLKNQKVENPHQFLELRKKIDEALISSSPSCYFPYPISLNRLVEEENKILEQKRHLYLTLNENPLDTPTKVSLNQSQKSFFQKGASVIFSKTFSQTRKTLRKQTSSGSLMRQLENVKLPQSITAYSPIRPTGQLLTSVKIGLDHLLLDTKSLEGFNQHQSITIGFSCHPIGCPDHPCLGPVMSKIDYFKYNAPRDTQTVFPRLDQPLGDTIRHWSNQCWTPCQLHIDEQTRFIPGLLVDTPLGYAPDTPGRPIPPAYDNPKRSESSSIMTLASSPFFSKSPSSSSAGSASHGGRHCTSFHGCQMPLYDHVFSFSQDGGKVQVFSQVENLCKLGSQDQIMTWLTCSTCDASTAPANLSNQASLYSFAKFLELLFYSEEFATPEPFCDHMVGHRSDIKLLLIRSFSYRGVTFKFTYENMKLYELRLPRLQLDYQEYDTLLTFETPRMCKIALQTLKNQSLADDVNLFFQAIDKYLEKILDSATAESHGVVEQGSDSPESSGRPLSHHTDVKVLKNEINALRKKLEIDHANILTALSNTNENELNDFRNYLSIQSNFILDYLDQWKASHANETSIGFYWEKPDYVASNDVHCFPGSSVLVRETEPSSIIAYTLSSNDYIQEVLSENDEERTSNSNTSSNTDGTKKHLGNSIHLPFITKPSPKPHVFEGYYSSIERKYESSSTGTILETASLRTLMTEMIKSESSDNDKSKTLELKEKVNQWIKHQEEHKLDNVEGNIERSMSERSLKPLRVSKQEDTKEVKIVSVFRNIKQHDKKTVSPHIKHKYVHNGIEFTCIVYYAKEFEALRKQCDVNQLMIESLSRCQVWSASGGKSKSCFYKTKDDRFVVKEMVNSWNLAEKDAFLNFAQKYFEHLKNSTNESSTLSKIFGFFTIKMKSLADKKKIIDLDVMVMEHLFYNQKIIKRFDFKGIQDRHVEEVQKQLNDVTLWDGDWIEDYRTKLFVNEQSKSIMELAIFNDTEFLSKSNVMDYSLLIGIDHDKHEITVGIVDYIGVYTWYKKIESKSKSTLKPRKEVTIIPPDQYKFRFCREVCDYFIPIPGKFDLVDESKTFPSLLI